MKTKSRNSISRIATTVVLLLLFLLGVWFTEQAQRAATSANPEFVKPAEPVVPTQAVKLPPWSEVQPANHGTNPIPNGFVQTAVYEDVARLAFPTPAPVGVGLRARVLLGEISGATGRHKNVRIEEVASIKENRLVERRVMPADHLVVYAQQGKTEAEVRAGLPEGFVIRKKLSSGMGVSPISPATRRYLIGFESKNADSLETATEALKKLPIITSAVPDGYIFSASIPNDPLFNQQWGLHNTGQTVNGITGTPDADIDAPEAWDLTTGSSAVTVAVIDSGIDLTHEDLIDNIWTNPGESGGGKETNGIDDDGNGLIDDVHGWDFVNDDNVPQDDFGHGTHVAGIIGAKGNNGVGVAGVCWNVGLASLKALRSNGSGLWSDVIEAVNYARLMKMQIANLSLGAYGSAPLGVQLAFEEADNVLFCCAAGNGSLVETGNRVGDDIDQIVFMPAAFALGHVMSIAAIKQDGQLASFSNYGHVSVDLAGPGVGILSCKLGGGYEMKSGTSMAAAAVTGAAVCTLAREGKSPLEMRNLLQVGVNRQPRLLGSCSTEGTVSLQKASLAGTRNIQWRHLAPKWIAQGTFSLYGHTLPDGRIPYAGGPANTLNSPAKNVLSVFDGLPFLIDSDLQLYAASIFRTSSLGQVVVGSSALSLDKFAPIPGCSNVIAVSGGSGENSELFGACLVLREDGTVLSFGAATAYTGRETPPSASATVPTAVPGLTGIVQILSDPTGLNHFVLRNDGAVLVFGANANSELGLGHNNPVPTPVPVLGLPFIKKIFTSSTRNVFCLDEQSKLWGWGQNDYNLGNGGGGPVTMPTYLPMWGEVCDINSSVASGTNVTLATRYDGRILCSSIYGGQLFGGTPQLLPSLAGFQRAPAGGGGVDKHGRWWTWDKRLFSSIIAGQPSGPITQVPLAGPAIDGATTVWLNSIVLLADGRTQSWGSNLNQGLGQGGAGNYSVPAEVSQFSGADRVYGKLGEIAVATWSNNTIKSVGRTNPFTLDVRPVDLPGLSGVARISNLGASTLVALREDRTLWTFDLNKHFEYYPSTFGQQVFIKNPNISGVRSFSSSYRTAIALDELGRFWAVQNSTNVVEITGSLPSDFGSPVEIEPGLGGTIIRCADGKIWTFGAVVDAVGTTLVASGLRLVVDAGSVQQMAWPLLLKSDATVCMIDSNEALNDVAGLAPAGQVLAPIIKIASSQNASGAGNFALRADGSIWTWGRPALAGRGELGGFLEPGKIETLADAVDIFPGFECSYSKRVDGSIWGWGSNGRGLLAGSAWIDNPAETLNYSISTEVASNGLEINNWLYTHFSKAELGSINISGDEADPDRDGLTNLMEYALGSDPKVPSDRDGIDVGLTCSFEAVGSEALSAAESDGAVEHHFTVTLSRRAKRPGIIYRVEISDDLVNWTASASRLQLVREETPIQAIYRDMEPLSVTQRRWARLVIRKGN